MDDPFLLIKAAVIELLKQIDPMVDVYAEEIKKTEFEEEKSETYYFVDMVPVGNQTVDKFFTDIGVLVDIAFHDKEELNVLYLKKQAVIDMKIRPVLCFGDRKITINNSSSKIVDHVLHYSFPITFRVGREETEELERMGELETFVKEGM